MRWRRLQVQHANGETKSEIDAEQTMDKHYLKGK
jgi:hypothetical protein